MRTSVVIAAVGVVTVSGIAVGGALASPAAGEDVVEPVLVGAVQVDDSASASPTAASTSTGGAAPVRPRTVTGLDELSGLLAHQSDDVDEFEVGGVELELGPEEWMAAATSPADYDGDGTIGTVLDELQGLVGSQVVVAGRLGDDGEELDVYRIQGLAFREVSGGPAPWERGAGEVASRERVEEAALEAVGAGARVLEVDEEDDAGAAWEVEVLGADGREHRVLLDAAGVVLDIRAEDTPSRTTTTTPAATRGATPTATQTTAGDDKGGERPEGVSDDGPGDDKGGQRADEDEDDDEDDDDSGKGRGRGGDDDEDESDD